MAPLSLATLFFMALIVLHGAVTGPANLPATLLGLAGFILILWFDWLTRRSPEFRTRHGWSFAITFGIVLGSMPYILSDTLEEVFHIMVAIGVLAVATNSGRLRAMATLTIVLLLTIPTNLNELSQVNSILDYLAPFIIALITLETYIRTKRTTQQHIRRLETINKVSRQLMQSLDKDQVLTLLDETIQDTLEADTYFIGLIQGDGNLKLDIFFDDHEYFNGMVVPLKGSLSEWIIKNQRELFLPDLRDEVNLEDVDVRIIGREKTNLSWIGVPLKTSNITGVMALASYKPNAFDLADIELLSSLAQHVTLALDNTIRHAQVEEQTRLDSLTGVYNHGYFLKKLSEQAAEAEANNSQLGLIMLDIDYFKQYNDTHGHLVGDNILNALCSAVRQHIKQNDAVGRWGGEEFIVSLPNANGEQAMQVAKRISDTMGTLHVKDRNQNKVLVPTISQGIAVFPHEADDIYKLIDLADKRLYVAKDRGRNQIEPKPAHWLKIQIANKNGQTD